jgi:peptidoglycan/xylan/chitin deacetylase (PgdA/CDA1 family)
MVFSSSKLKIPILMYHSIAEHAQKPFTPFLVTPSVFSQQMAYLSEQHYTPITITQLVHASTYAPETLPLRPLAITFDDGFEDFFLHAWPILQHYHFPATLYISTAYINGTSRWLQREGEGQRRMLTWQQVQELAAGGIECGGHTHTHPQLDVLSRAQAREEIYRNKQILESQIQQDVRSFAYPYGYYTKETQMLVHDAGYTSACAVKHRTSSLQDDVFALARLMVTNHMHPLQFERLLTTSEWSNVVSPHRLLLRARTPIWQCIRRSSTRLSRLSPAHSPKGTRV